MEMRRLPAGPGTASSMALNSVRLKPVCPNWTASPTRAIKPCTKTRDVANARDREWLNPSAARRRMKASRTSLNRPVAASVRQASSPVRFQVSRTQLAVLIGGQAWCSTLTSVVLAC